MLGPVLARPLGRVERKAEERETGDARQRLARRGARGHPPSHRLSACYQRQVGYDLGARRHRGADGGVEHRRRVGPPAAGFVQGN